MVGAPRQVHPYPLLLSGPAIRLMLSCSPTFSLPPKKIIWTDRTEFELNNPCSSTLQFLKLKFNFIVDRYVFYASIKVHHEKNQNFMVIRLLFFDFLSTVHTNFYGVNAISPNFI